MIRRLRLGGIIGFLLCAALGINHLVSQPQTRQGGQVVIGFACGAIVSAGGFVFLRRRAIRRLARLVTGAQKEIVPIAELGEIDCAYAPFARAAQKILRELRQQKADYSTLHEELRERIASRTEILKRKIGSLEVQNSRDPLTGLNNRRRMVSDLPPLVEAYTLHRRDSCLLMIDIDHFKDLNDTMGHTAGDQLLRELGQIIRSVLREDDRAYRCGGDEFVVVLQDCSALVGSDVAARLCSMMRQLTKPLPLPHPPSLSIGVCALSELQKPTPSALYETADVRLYAEKAKRPGRRRSA